MADGNDLEQLRNKLKSVIHGNVTSKGVTDNRRAQTITSSDGKLKTSNSKSSNDKISLLKEIDDLNLKILTLQKVHDLDKRQFVELKMKYERRVREAYERASMYKHKVMVANERINDLEGTLEMKNERISSLVAELQIVKQAAHVDLDRNIKNAQYDNQSNGDTNHIEYTGELLNEYADTTSAVNLDTTKLLKLNLKTFEFDENCKESTSLVMSNNIHSHQHDIMEENIMDATSISSDSIFTEDLMKIRDYPFLAKQRQHSAPIYNSNPITRALGSDDELYLKPIRSEKHKDRPSSFNFESALEDSTERIAGL